MAPSVAHAAARVYSATLEGARIAMADLEISRQPAAALECRGSETEVENGFYGDGFGRAILGFDPHIFGFRCLLELPRTTSISQLFDRSGLVRYGHLFSFSLAHSHFGNRGGRISPHKRFRRDVFKYGATS